MKMKSRRIGCFFVMLLSFLCLVGCGESSEKDEVTITETPIIEEAPDVEEIPVAQETLDAEETDENMVWIPTKGGKKYHSSETCSNMSNPREVTLSEAEENGFTACKHCH